MKELPSEEQITADILSHSYREAEVLLSSGAMSDYYFDMRSLHQNPVLREQLLSSFMFNIPSDTEVVAGIQTGGASFASELAGRTMMPYSYARKEEKPHGMQNKIEGVSDVDGKIVVLVEDATTTAKSILEAAKVYRSAGAIVTTAMAFLLRDFKALSNLDDEGIDLIYFAGPIEIENFRHERTFPPHRQ